jgi:hypothetical protein
MRFSDGILTFGDDFEKIGRDISKHADTINSEKDIHNFIHKNKVKNNLLEQEEF